MSNDGKKFSDKLDETSGRKEKDEKTPKNGANSAKKKMGEINKAVSKDKRDQFKGEIVRKKKSRRRRRPKKSGETTKVVEPQKQRQTPVEPVNPFDDSKLPTPEYEQERERELGSSDEIFDEDEEQSVSEAGGGADSDQQELINPFEATEPSASTIEKKALDDKLLDRKNKKAEANKKIEHKEEETPEETEQSAEQLGEIGAAEEAKAADVAEVSVVEPVAESAAESVVEPVAESAAESVVEPAAESAVESVSGLAEPAEVVEIGSDLSSETEEFKKEIWDILGQAGVTKKRIITFLVIFAVVILFIMFGGLRLFGIGDGEEVVTEVTQTVESDVPEIISSYVFGLEYAEPKTSMEGVLGGIEAVLYLGEGESEFESRLVYYVDLLRKMDSIYATDIYALIDMSVDRRAALQDHIDEMNAIIVEADAVYFEIKLRLESFDAEFEVLAIERDDLELQFFTATDGLMPRDSYEYLLSFIEVSKETTEIKAYYNAYRMVVDLYIIYLDLLEPRYQDILINTEALIQGIRVFDIPASDIEAILSVEE
jgi:hypothetical protein